MESVLIGPMNVLYMCLPSKFGTGCSAVHSAYNARIHDVDHKGRRKYTDLPAFKYCRDENNENVTDLPEAKASNFTYENLYEITIPGVTGLKPF
ncbi:MAG: hypothetical protein SPJ14_01970 [Succinivibrio sp.]|nr:hypothetical protein [Succinivibrio sp.]